MSTTVASANTAEPVSATREQRPSAFQAARSALHQKGRPIAELEPFKLGLSASPARRWFERRAVVLGSAVFLSVAIFVVRELVSSRGEILGLLYVIPVALIGLELGLRAGVAAALGALLLLAVRPPSSDPALDALGLGMRGVALLSVGSIAGRFSDRMREAQIRLHEHFRSAGHILGVHERERRGIAEELHEQAAQTMAAALLLVSRMELQTLDRLTQEQAQDVRDSVRACIDRLCRLAATLRPPALVELGLLPALERMIDSHGGARQLLIEPPPEELCKRLTPETQTLAYRVIEEAVACMSGAIRLHMALDGAHTLRIQIDGGRAEYTGTDEGTALATTQARLRIIGGTLSSSLTDGHMRVGVEIPLLETAPC